MMGAVERMAVIDMGSNSFRLVVYERDPAQWKRADEIREAVRVSAGMGEEGVLKPEAIERAVRTAEVFAASAARRGSRTCAGGHERDPRRGPTATSCWRVAGRRARRAGDLGQEEARYGYLAIANTPPWTTGSGWTWAAARPAHADRGPAARATRVVPLGAVRVSERFLPGEEASSKQLKALRKHVSEQ